MTALGQTRDPFEVALAELCRARYGIPTTGQAGVVCLPTEAAWILAAAVVVIVIVLMRRG